jgi:hypothetical protein
MIPKFGSALQSSDEWFLLQENISAMGSSFSGNVGSLMWCEAFSLAITTAKALDVIRLLSNQLNPFTLSVYGQRYANIFQLPLQGNGQIPSNLQSIRQTVSMLDARFGTIPNTSNFIGYLTGALGLQSQNYVDGYAPPNLSAGIFIDLEDAHELQPLATGGTDGYAPGTVGQLYFAPLAQVFVRIWQNRDKNDNLLISQSAFDTAFSNCRAFAEDWMPSNIALVPMQLIYDGYNTTSGTIPTVSGTAGTTFIVGTNSKFTQTFSNASIYPMPMEVVDDDNILNTYIISEVVSDTVLTLTSNIHNTITNRTFRCLGVQADTIGVADWALCNL